MHGASTLALGLAAALITPTTAFWRMSCPGRLVDERADPIVNPGAVSGHVHSIAGGNAFGFEMTFQQARKSECSSCPIKADLSNYWTPKLYYHAQNGSFINVPQAGDGNGVLGGMTVYYQQRPGPNNDKLHAFPKGFRMLAGDPFVRHFKGNNAAKAVSFACLNYNGPATPETNNFPNNNCPDGLRVQIYFPSCWDGKNLDSPDHKSHMHYPIGEYNNGACPESHPVHLISIFYEVIYQTNLFADEWYGNKQPFVFSSGDPTGYGMHGDFVNGWNIDVLQKATDECNNDSGNISDCPVFANNLFTDSECRACMLPSSVDEKVNGVLEKLPGCNPVKYGPAEATPPSTCDDPGTISQQATYYTDVTSTLKYKYIGCGTDDYYTRTFTGQSESTDDMTVEKCVKYCKVAGFKFAGLEYSGECYCGNTLPADRAPKKGVMGNCQMTCSGDEGEYCGGSSALSIYKACGTGTCENVSLGVTKRNVTEATAELKGRGEKAHVLRHLGLHGHKHLNELF